MKRHEIDENLKWDTSLIYKEDDEYYKEIEEVKDLANKLTSYKGNITSDSQTLLDFLRGFLFLIKFYNFR